ncbi:MAG TPA: MucR family transcriptional regulator [Alphaproteobacteria bacterium]|jgi:predicted transcriptional regulator|nr:MucR family transcriptional regulator [Alphaproteobacteria bacterium]HAM48600.1 MucR family transcriptional regulator [Alphaproteobacteria bacterium]HBA42637.1 MucR family transcriptional regulator [Alphaproteobacteria bacterium]HBC53194.1 MucR family transcriptional regulator [Alphaproteobacteria bacterium]
MDDKNKLIDMTAEIVSAYVGNNEVAAGDLPSLVQNVYNSLNNVAQGLASDDEEPARPAISVRRSVTPDYIICLEDGKKFKSLKRHLRAHYDMTPEEYRAKWGLPKDYPMVAPNYAKARSALAKQMGLGQKGRGKA